MCVCGVWEVGCARVAEKLEPHLECGEQWFVKNVFGQSEILSERVDRPMVLTVAWAKNNQPKRKHEEVQRLPTPRLQIVVGTWTDLQTSGRNAAPNMPESKNTK